MYKLLQKLANKSYIIKYTSPEERRLFTELTVVMVGTAYLTSKII